ncbi:flagellar protein FlaG [Thioalkalivibrio sp. ALJT]|uniref:flagellar protein FlaG n=1 Tax=Thioalkalivibrio sp. ALJT TaxID=1158146 RepID=UPI0009DA91CC|nr:flagellar protein FlaG [Thioalkalivibrio sp. ALJT]
MSDGIGNIGSPLATLGGRGAPVGERAPAAGVGQDPREKVPVALPGSSASASTRPAEPAAPAGAERSPSVDPVDASDMDRVVESINAYLQTTRRALEFSVDDVSGRTVITVMDADRENVIRQIPPEQMLALAEQLRDEQTLDATGLVDKA